jgi:hypothetical protein
MCPGQRAALLPVTRAVFGPLSGTELPLVAKPWEEAELPTPAPAFVQGDRSDVAVVATRRGISVQRVASAPGKPPADEALKIELHLRLVYSTERPNHLEALILIDPEEDAPHLIDVRELSVDRALQRLGDALAKDSGGSGLNGISPSA